MAYRAALGIDLIDSHIGFRLFEGTRKRKTKAGSEYRVEDVASTWTDSLEEGSVSYQQIHILGSDLVKAAKIFGVEAAESDIVRRFIQKYNDDKPYWINEEAGDIVVPIWRGETEKITVRNLRAQINGQGGIDIAFEEQNGYHSEISYQGRSYVQWHKNSFELESTTGTV